jgi:hypothetical protein
VSTLITCGMGVGCGTGWAYKVLFPTVLNRPLEGQQLVFQLVLAEDSECGSSRIAQSATAGPAVNCSG